MAAVGRSVDAPVLITTVDDPAGYIVASTAGLVIGSYGHPVNRFLDQVKALTPGSATNGPGALSRARRSALDQLAQAAIDAGCNAVVGVRFTSRAIGDTWVELCAYGTGVTLAPLEIGLAGGHH